MNTDSRETYPRSPRVQRASLITLIGAGLQAVGRLQDGEALIEAEALLDEYAAPHAADTPAPSGAPEIAKGAPT